MKTPDNKAGELTEKLAIQVYGIFNDVDLNNLDIDSKKYNKVYSTIYKELSEGIEHLEQKLKQKEERISELETLSDKKLIGIISQVINRFDEHRKEVDLYIADKDWHYWVGGEQGDVKVRIEQVLDLFTNHQLSDCENELRTGIEELLKQ